MSSRDLSLKTSSTNSNPKMFNNNSVAYNLSKPIPNDLDAEELAMWKLAYSAGIIIPIECLKSIYELCKFGCDPNDIAKCVSELCKSYTEKKEFIKQEKNLKNRDDGSGQSTTGSNSNPREIGHHVTRR